MYGEVSEYRYTENFRRHYTALLEWRRVIRLCDNLSYVTGSNNRPNA